MYDFASNYISYDIVYRYTFTGKNIDVWQTIIIYVTNWGEKCQPLIYLLKPYIAENFKKGEPKFEILFTVFHLEN